MSSLSFRPKPIDIYKPLPIYKNEIEEDGMQIARSLPNVPTGMEKEEEEERHIQKAISASLLALPSEAIVIPTPTCIIDDEYEIALKRSTFRLPQQFVREKKLKGKKQELQNVVEYDLEPQDIEWLNSQPYEITQHLDENTLEWMIDAMEKEAESHEKRIFKLETSLQLFPKFPTEVVETVHKYWENISATNNHKTFIRRLVQPPAFNDPSPYKAFRIPEKKKTKKKRAPKRNDEKALRKMRKLREEFEKVRTLLEILKKRDLLKRNLMQHKKAIYEQEIDQGIYRPYEEREKKAYTYLKSSLKTSNKSAPQLWKGPEDDSSSDFYYDSDESYDENAVELHSSDEEFSIAEDDEEYAFDSLPRVTTFDEVGQFQETQINLEELNHIQPIQEVLTFPKLVGDYIHLGNSQSTFRGRARYGRGGRILIDRLHHSAFSESDNYDRNTWQPQDFNKFSNFEAKISSKVDPIVQQINRYNQSNAFKYDCTQQQQQPANRNNNLESLNYAQNIDFSSNKKQKKNLLQSYLKIRENSLSTYKNSPYAVP